MLWGHEIDIGRVDMHQITRAVEMGREITTSRIGA